MANFNFATLTNAQAALSSRLYDATQQQWPAAELTLYIVEALRTWNALTSFWRNEFTFSLAAGVVFYDITNLTVAPNTLRPITVTDGYLAQMIETHLLEPLTSSYPLTWSGSLQFDVAMILDAITRRQNETLGQTGCTITRQTVTAPMTNAGILLGDSTIDIRRVAWLPGSLYPVTILRETDRWAKWAYDYTYTAAVPAPPNTWMQSTDPPPQFKVDRIPPVSGNYEVLTANAGNTANATAAQLLSVPDDWSWVVKWGALGDLLSRESNAKDQPRATYCQKRYLEGLMFLQNSGAVLELELNGVPMGVDAITNGDAFNWQWEAAAQAPPNRCYQSGFNLLAFPPPDAGGYTALVGVVENAPVPVAGGDFIQCNRADYDVILDMAQHLAMFKIPALFAETIPLYQNFLNRAAVYNRKLRAMGSFNWAQWDISQTEEERNPRMEAQTG